jgi:hypothetical protein
MILSYKFLNINNYNLISNEVYQYTVDHTQVLLLKNPFVDQDIGQMLHYCPLLNDFLNTYKLIPKRLAIIVCAENSEITMHKDNDGIDSYVRILWPVRNCQGSMTKLWQVPDDAGTLTVDTNGIVYTAFPKDQPREQIGEFELLSPVLFNATCAHSVNPAPKVEKITIGFNRPYIPSIRISFTIGFDRELSISKSIESWSDFEFYN